MITQNAKILVFIGALSVLAACNGTSTKSCKEPCTESCNGPSTKSYHSPYTKPGTEPCTEPGTESCTESCTESSTKPCKEPCTESCNGPYTKPSTEPSTESCTEPCTEPGTESSNKPHTAACSKPSSKLCSKACSKASSKAQKSPYADFWRYAQETGLSAQEAVDVYGEPNEDLNWAMALSNAAADEDWERLAELTEKDRHNELGSYYRNLANAMQGHLSQDLMSYYAPFERALFLPVDENAGRFMIAQSGEVWYQLGEMTMAEHSAILGLLFSPKQNGERFLSRLGEINHIWGDEAAAAKYFNLTGKTSDLSKKELACKRSLLPKEDLIHSANNYRAALQALVKANSDNDMAYEYLLCLDLLCKDLDAFVTDFKTENKVTRLFQEAALIWMVATDNRTEQALEYFQIEENVFNDFQLFTTMFGNTDFQNIRQKFGETYWFYFKYAKKNEKK